MHSTDQGRGSKASFEAFDLPSAPASKGRRLLTRQSKIGLWGLVFVLPSVVFFAVFSVFPVFFGFYLSLTDYPLLRPPVYVGFENYRYLLEDPLFIRAAVNTIWFVLGATVPVIALSFAFALLFEKSFRGNRFLRVLMFSPVLPPLIVVAVVWRLLLHPNGLLTAIFGPIFGVNEINWLTDASIAPYAMIFVHNWTIIPFFMMIWLAGLAGIPDDVREAAVVDGSGPVRTTFEIVLPMLKPTTVLVTALATINAFQAFILQFVLAPDQGGPADSTLTLALLVWRYGFQYFRMGDAAAISFVLFGIILVVTVLQLWLGRER